MTDRGWGQDFFETRFYNEDEPHPASLDPSSAIDDSKDMGTSEEARILAAAITGGAFDDLFAQYRAGTGDFSGVAGRFKVEQSEFYRLCAVRGAEILGEDYRWACWGRGVALGNIVYHWCRGWRSEFEPGGIERYLQDRLTWTYPSAEGK